ncbi:MAG: hypothetical protein Q4C30_02000 [Bacteroidia bacterium]|nr:hypothetical protein [Bacteroidia bacterium]
MMQQSTYTTIIKFLRIFVVLLFLGITTSLLTSKHQYSSVVFAQTKPQFSTEPTEFIQQLGEYFSTSASKKKAEEYFEEFEKFFMAPQTSDELRARIIHDINLLRKLKSARPLPDYKNLIEVLRLTDNNPNISGNNFTVWHDQLIKKLTVKPNLKYINKFIQSTNMYAHNRTLGYTSAIQWRIDTSNAVFVEGEKQLEIDVPSTRLVCASQTDSIIILDTKGKYLFDEMQWYGTEGRITWERVGLPADQTYAVFGEYKHDMTKSTVNIKQAKFVNKDYFAEPLYGTVEHRLISVQSLHGKNYPKFETTDERREVKQIFKDMDYHGGFAQDGAKMRGSGTGDMPAELSIYRNDTLFIVVRSLSFTLFPNRIESAQASISIKLDDKEIVHPGLHFTYLDKGRTIRMIRLGEGIEQTKYFDTFHMVNMDVQQIRWHMDQPYMELGMVDGAARAYATFESVNYYRPEFFHQLQGMDLTHPFQYIADFYHYMGGMPFTAADYSDYRGIQRSSIRNELINLSYQGFIDYDQATDMVSVRQRLLDYLDYQVGKKDYDVIRFESNVDLTPKDNVAVLPSSQASAPNGILDLKNYDIQLIGVKGIAVSDYQNVSFFPEENKIQLKRNRDFQFNGRLDAGMLSLYGDGFYFSYDDFRVELKRVDRMRLKVKTDKFDHEGKPVQETVKSMVRDITGYVEIDRPDNKSSRKLYAGYPKLTSKENSKVYYDDQSIQNGRYKRDVFYYTVDPFTFEDINNIQHDNAKFEGVLTTGIFPDIRHPLVIREDNSLGMVVRSPNEGYPIYDGVATFYNDVDLSWSGLLGNGELEYLTSRSISPRFTFLPDIVHGKTSDFIVRETVGTTSYPGVELGQSTTVMVDGTPYKGQTQLYFAPFAQQLNVSSTRGKFNMFPTTKNESGFECQLMGALNVTPTGLWGTGRIDIDEKRVKMEGAYMSFDDHSVTADTTFFRTEAWREELQRYVPDYGELRKDIVVKHPDTDPDDAKGKKRKFYEKEYRLADAHSKGRNEALKENATFQMIDPVAHGAVMERRMTSRLDFATRIGEFKFTVKGNDMTFKEVKYEANVQFFTWNMDHNEITIGQRGSSGNRFYSTAEGDYEDEERLNFLVPVAVYTGQELFCEEVKEVNAADATIQLLDKEGKLTIRSANSNKSKIDQLTNTQIVIAPKDSVGNSISSHTIYNAKARIDGSQSYQAWGDYDFYNALNKKYPIYMDSIGTNVDRRTKKGTTYAWGRVGEDINFDEHFAYKGKLGIQAGRQLLEYRGGARMIQESPYLTKGYVRFESVVDPNNVRIPIGERTVNWKNGEIDRGLFRTYDSTHVYSAFLEVKKSKGDRPIGRAEGVLYFNKVFNSFDILPEEKIEKPEFVGNLLRYTPETHTAMLSGNLDLQTTLPPLRKHGLDLLLAGDAEHNREANEVKISSVMELYSEIPTELSTMVFKQLLSSKAKMCDSTAYRYESRMVMLHDTAEFNQIKRERWTGMYVDPKTKEEYLPDDNYSPTFTFSDFNLYWCTSKRAWMCDTVVNIMMMHNRNVNRIVRIKSEMRIFKDNTDMEMHISFDGDSWIYLRFYNKLFMYSSDHDFNKAIIDLKSKRVSQGNKKQVQKFLTNFGCDFGDDNADSPPEEDEDDAYEDTPEDNPDQQE